MPTPDHTADQPGSEKPLLCLAPLSFGFELEGEDGEVTQSSIWSWLQRGVGPRAEMLQSSEGLVVTLTEPEPTDPAGGTGSTGVDWVEVVAKVDGVEMVDPAEYDDIPIDFCAYCERERDCSRLETLTTPHLLKRHGGGRATAYYQCAYGHAWTCHWNWPGFV